MNTLIIINDAPYGTEKAYNALRIANQLLKDHENSTVNVFLMADAAACGIAGQKTPNGYYNIERMLTVALRKGAQIKYCGTCADARGLQMEWFIEGCERGTIPELSQWIAEADKTLTL